MNENWKKDFEKLILPFFDKNDDIDYSIRSKSDKVKKALELLEVVSQDGTSNQTLTGMISSLESYCNDSNDTTAISNSSSGVNDEEQALLLPICEFIASDKYSNCTCITFFQFANFLLRKGSIDDEENSTQAKFIAQAIEQRDETLLTSVLEQELFRFWKKIISIMIHSIDGRVDDDKSLKKESSLPFDPDDASGAIIAAGDYTAEKIYGGAKFLSKSLTGIVPTVTNGIENLGELAKKNIEPSFSNETSSNVESNDDDKKNTDEFKITEKDIVAFSEASVQATDVFRSSTQALTGSIHNISSKGIKKLGNEWEKNQVGKELCQQDELRESFAAIGKVGVATVGATLNVAEAIFDATKAVAQTSVKVTADVAQHKFGGNTGQLIENTGTATGNVLRGITHVGTLEGKVMSKIIAQKAAKSNMEDKLEQNDQKVVEKIDEKKE